MQHLLKSNEPDSSPSTPSTGARVLEFRRPADRRRNQSRALDELGETEQDLDPLRGQVTEIITAILAETGPAEAEVREKLRRHVDNHPGHPEKALLKHLLNLSDQPDESA